MTMKTTNPTTTASTTSTSTTTTTTTAQVVKSYYTAASAENLPVFRLEVGSRVVAVVTRCLGGVVGILRDEISLEYPALRACAAMGIENPLWVSDLERVGAWLLRHPEAMAEPR